MSKLRVAALAKCGTVAVFVVLAMIGPAAASPKPDQGSGGNAATEPSVRAKAVAASPVITFSEFPEGTAIATQYQDKGIIFGGDAPFITSDGSNPTTPVLSGTPRFQGAITGTFVTPDGKPRTMRKFSLDVGYINNPGSVAITVFNAKGAVINTTSADSVGIVPITVAHEGIASFKVASVSQEDAGFAIDNVDFEQQQTLAALGDSYSSGEGSGPYDKASGGCHRSDTAWPRLVDEQRSDLVMGAHVACSGAKFEALKKKFKNEPAQLDQLKQMAEPAGVITMTMGGNDLGFSPVLTACYIDNCTYKPLFGDSTLGQAAKRLPKLKKTAIKGYQDLKAAAGDARIVIVGYPRMFPDKKSEERCLWLSNAERRELNELAKKLDDTLRSAAQEAGVEFVSVLEALDGHEACSRDSWIFRIGLSGGQQRGHPTKQGQEAIAGMVRAYLDAV
ncbi:hypothetical protein Aple_026470 [Acrocarpospora pleiomorpha]|uniref:SGNH hydrolase-type esterase domain-containing protein n=1 Tax=Acrocarpospora pleiomorpha TaxID=90975 RepID=A0A5M3XJ98_9ACTN|nr:SGNH/GDSL hydrolase family protein [Acrocarpospora pleiomorpha]GES19751.1 hypothetical protein Aple_026470 [Acrocarpospora pleiomorpha]